MQQALRERTDKDDECPMTRPIMINPVILFADRPSLTEWFERGPPKLSPITKINCAIKAAHSESTEKYLDHRQTKIKLKSGDLIFALSKIKGDEIGNEVKCTDAQIEDEEMNLFLVSLGLEEHRARFERENVSMELLKQLNNEDLKELGIHKFGDRKLMLIALKNKTDSNHRNKRNPRMVFNEEYHGNHLLFDRGDTVKISGDNIGFSSCIFGEEVNHEMCSVFNLELEWQTASGRYPSFLIGYISSSIQSSIGDWNGNLGYGQNKGHSTGYYVHCGYDYFREYTNGTFRSLPYRAPSNFKEGDLFKMSFNFAANELVLHHNGTKAETVSLYNHKKITAAFTLFTFGDDEVCELKVTNYEFIRS